MVLKAFVISSETANATPFCDTMASAMALTQFTASTVKRPRRKPYWLLCHPDTRCDRWASRRVAIIFSRSLPTSSRGHTGLYAAVESKGRPSFFSRTSFAIRHARGYTPSLRHLVRRRRRRGAMMFINSAQARPGIPSGPGVTSREAILFVASSSSSSVTSISFFHSTVPVEDDRAYLTSLSSCRGHNIPMTLASNTGSILAVSGGGGTGAQLLHHYSVRPPPRIIFNHLNKVPLGPSFRDLDLPL